MSLKYRVAYVPWWRPIRLAAKHADGWDFIGWVWRTKAYQTYNLCHGWIAFLHDQTPEKLASCPYCQRPMHEVAPSDRESSDPTAPSPSPNNRERP